MRLPAIILNSYVLQTTDMDIHMMAAKPQQAIQRHLKAYPQASIFAVWEVKNGMSALIPYKDWGHWCPRTSS